MTLGQRLTIVNVEHPTSTISNLNQPPVMSSPSMIVSHTPRSTIVIASVFAVLGFIIVFVISIIYLRRRRFKRNIGSNSPDVSPFTTRATNWISPIKQINQKVRGKEMKIQHGIEKRNVTLGNEVSPINPFEENGTNITTVTGAQPSMTSDNNARTENMELEWEEAEGEEEGEGESGDEEEYEGEDELAIIALRFAAILRERGIRGEEDVRGGRRRRGPRRNVSNDDATIHSVPPPAYC